MRIGLDLLHVRSRIGGGWNYIGGLLEALGRHGGADNTYYVYCTPHSETLVPDQANFVKRRFDLDPERALRRTLVQATALQAAARRDRLEVLHVFSGSLPPVRVCPTVVTFYDFVAEASPTSVGSWAKCCYYRIMSSFVLRQASLLTPISESIAHAIRQRSPRVADQMVVVPLPLGPTLRPADAAAQADFRARHKLPEHFWLYVAHYYPHKNHERLFQAYAALRQQQPATWPLVLRGNRNGAEARLSEMIARTGLAEHVRWLPPLTDPEMALLYSSATALIYPSLYEGAGLPLVEAMACGCPVVASDLPTTREFCGDAALTFDPADPGAITAAMARLATDATLRQECVARGLQQAQRYAAEHVIGVLRQAYAQAAGAPTSQ